MKHRWQYVGVLMAALVLGQSQLLHASGDDYAIGDRLATPSKKETADQYREIGWDDLIPQDWLPEDLLEELFDDVPTAMLDDTDPKAVELMRRVQEIWDSAPMVEAMDGQKIRIPGFVVPLEGDDSKIYEFLLVPYFGACIHVPPPPANQLIHVVPDKALDAELNMVPVWVSGDLKVKQHESGLGLAGYILQGREIKIYEANEVE